MSARILRHRPSPLPVFNDEDDSVFTNDFDDDSFRSVFSSGSLSPPPPEMPLRQSSPIEPPISRAERRALLAILDQVNDDPTLARPAGNDPRIRPISQPFPLERSGSASGSASTSTSDPESAARRYTTQEKGKGRAVLPSPIAVEDDEGDRDESIQVIGVRIPENGKRTPSEDVVVREAGSLGEDDQRGLGSFSEYGMRRGLYGVGLMRRSLSGVLLRA